MKKVLSVTALLAISICLNAQNILNYAKYESPKQLITAKGKTANVRTKPDIKAPKLAHDDNVNCYDIKIDNNTLYEVIDDMEGWYKIALYEYEYGLTETPVRHEGYVSKTVTRESPITAIDADDVENSILSGVLLYQENPKQKNVEYAYMSKTASERFPYILVTGTEDPNFDNMPKSLWLGQIVGNVVVFKYRTSFHIQMKNNYKGVDIIKYDPSAMIGTITFGDSFKEPVLLGYRRYGEIQLYNFDKYKDRQLEAIFGTTIQKEEVDKQYPSDVVYVNKEWLQK